MKYIALLFCLVALSFAVTTVTFSGNVTESETGVKHAEFKYRTTSVWTLPIDLGILGSYTLAAYVSAEVSATGTNTSGQINGDLIVGAIKFFSGKVPVSYIGYVAAQFNAVRTIDAVANTDVTTFNYTAAGGFVLTTYNKLIERNPSGANVREIALRNLKWNVANGSSVDGYLHYITLTASNPFLQTLLKAGESVSMTFLISEVLGEVTFGSVTTVVTPKSLESILEVNGWNYLSASNNLVFVCGVATGAAVGASTGIVTLSSGSGNNQVYAHFDGRVDVSGSRKSAKVTATKTTDFTLITDDVDIQASYDAVYHGAFNMAVVEVAFPAGAAKITYDPAIGSGTPIVNSAQTNFLFALLLAVIVLLI